MSKTAGYVETYSTLLTEIAEEAEAIAMRYFRSNGLSVERKSDGTAVTPADRAVEEMARSKVAKSGLVLDVLGDYAATLPPNLLLAKKVDQHPTELTTLVGRRFVSAIEAGHGRRWDEARVKWLTGGDRLTARGMRQDFFQFDPTHKLWVAANQKPRVRGTDAGIWARIKEVPFEQEFRLIFLFGNKADRLLTQPRRSGVSLDIGVEAIFVLLFNKSFNGFGCCAHYCFFLLAKHLGQAP